MSRSWPVVSVSAVTEALQAITADNAKAWFRVNGKEQTEPVPIFRRVRKKTTPLFVSGTKGALPERPAFHLSRAFLQCEELVCGGRVHALDEAGGPMDFNIRSGR